jgi:hypothetical protein
MKKEKEKKEKIEHFDYFCPPTNGGPNNIFYQA